MLAGVSAAVVIGGDDSIAVTGVDAGCSCCSTSSCDSDILRNLALQLSANLGWLRDYCGVSLLRAERIQNKPNSNNWAQSQKAENGRAQLGTRCCTRDRSDRKKHVSSALHLFHCHRKQLDAARIYGRTLSRAGKVNAPLSIINHVFRPTQILIPTTLFAPFAASTR